MRYVRPRTIWILALLAAPLIGVFRFRAARDTELLYRGRGLEGTAGVIANVAERWAGERRGDVALIADGLAIELAGADPFSPSTHADDLLAALVRHKGYDAAVLRFDDGRAIRAGGVPDDSIVVGAGRVDTPVVHLSLEGAPVGIRAAVATRIQAIEGHPVLLLRADLSSTLMPMLASPSRAALTGASGLVVRRGDSVDVLSLSAAGGVRGTTLPFEALPEHLRAAADGRPATLLSRSGSTTVYAAVRPVTSLGVAVIREMAAAEFMRPIYARAAVEGVLAGVLLAVIGLILQAFERNARLQRAQLQLVSLQLESLKNQLRPHFLFNALNAVAELVHSDQKAAEAMVLRLADLLRLSLRHRDQQEIPLSAELELVRAYIDVERIRFGSRLAVTFDVDDDVQQASVPALVLQPLVENAVKHGVSQLAGDGWIRVAASRIDGTLHLRVEDNGPGVVAHMGRRGLGIGLETTRERLRHLYGERQQLTMGNGSEGTRIDIELPFHAAPAANGAADEDTASRHA